MTRQDVLADWLIGVRGGGRRGRRSFLATAVTAFLAGWGGWRDGRSAFSLRPECHPFLKGGREILDARTPSADAPPRALIGATDMQFSIVSRRAFE
jgi:hypothetical protein